MKIAILSCFYPYRGGISQFNANCFEELGKRHNVKAFNFKRQYPGILFPGKTQYVVPGDEAEVIESERILDTINPLSWIRTARRINEWGADILLLRYWMPFFAPSLGYVARHVRKECKVISILDNVVPHERRPFDGILTKYFLSGTDGCVTLCPEVKDDLLKLKKDAVCTTLPHPIYSHFGEKIDRKEAERILGLENGRKNILFFGLIRDYKGLDILIEAFDLLDSPDLQLIIAGEPYGSFEKYREAIDRNHRKDSIHVFPNYIRDSEVKTYFCAADVVVLPYRSATQSGISSICYHFEVPMIVTDTGGLKGAIGERGTGMVAPDATPECIAGCINEFFSDTDARNGYVECIRKEKKRLGWEKFCADLVEFTETI